MAALRDQRMPRPDGAPERSYGRILLPDLIVGSNRTPGPWEETDPQPAQGVSWDLRAQTSPDGLLGACTQGPEPGTHCPTHPPVSEFGPVSALPALRP